MWPPAIQRAPGLDSLTRVHVGILLTVEVVTASGVLHVTWAPTSPSRGPGRQLWLDPAARAAESGTADSHDAAPEERGEGVNTSR